MNNDKVIELLVRAKRDGIHSSADEAGSPWMSEETIEELKAFYEGSRSEGVARMVDPERNLIEWKSSREATVILTRRPSRAPTRRTKENTMSRQCLIPLHVLSRLPRVLEGCVDPDARFPSSACTEESLVEGPPHGAHRDRGESFELHLQAEQLARPGGSLPSEVLGRTRQHADQHAVEPLAGLARAVASPPVVQPVHAGAQKLLGGADHGRCRQVQLGGDLSGAAPGRQPRND